jgi:Rha family phage regulatory protein
MAGLTINRNGGHCIDSREVAEIIGKSHNDLMKSIRRYCYFLNEGKISPVEFFAESTYKDSKGETRPCYLLSKSGCEMVANKLTGEKGVLFTAIYVKRFNEMESAGRAVLAPAVSAPRLGEYNAAARLCVRALGNAGTSWVRIVEFLRELYAPLGISVNTDTCDPDGIAEDVAAWYTATEIARECGMYSLSGRLHAQAVSCILNENIFIDAEHRCVETTDYGDHIGTSVKYDLHAKIEVVQWLTDNELPDEIYGFDRTYRVRYKD